jgi:hypothetical protein
MLDMHTPLSLNLRQWFSIGIVTYLLTVTGVSHGKPKHIHPTTSSDMLVLLYQIHTTAYLTAHETETHACALPDTHTHTHGVNSPSPS